MTTIQEQHGGMTVWDAARAAGIRFSTDATPEDRWITINGMRFHYLDWGNPDKPPFLLLHGGAQTAHSWDFFALSMRDDYHVIAPDQRGHGDSDWSEEGNYDPDFHVADMAAFTDAIGWDNFLLCGLSMGGRNAYGFAAKHPPKIKALVICDVGPEIQEKGSRHIREFLEGAYEFPDFEWLVERVKQYNPRRPEKQIRGSLLNNLKRQADGQWTWKHDRRRGVKQRAGAEWTDKAWNDVANVQCPTLVVRGAESDIFSMDTANRMLKLIRNSQFAEIPKAGHLVQGDNPVEFEKAVRRFLGGLPQ